MNASQKTSPPPNWSAQTTRNSSSNGGLSAASYEFIRSIIYKETRINLGEGKRELVAARVGKRLRALNCPSYEAYCKHIKENPTGPEFYNLIDAISTNHTFFFREINHFNFLNETILPSFANGQLGNPNRLKIWSCACSTGEEPYSVGISLSNFFEKLPNKDWSIDCSDISSRVLEFASKGVYDLDKIKNVPPEWRGKYFQKGENQMQGYCRVKPNVSQKIDFRRINLFESYPWTEKFQIIFCRNVMIYFDRKTQEDLVGRLAKHLVPGGYLLIGHAESLTGINHPYNTIKPAIYQLQKELS